MTCEQTRASFGAYLYDEIDRTERQHMEAHVRACPDCRHELETEQRFVSALARKMQFSEDVTR